MSRSGRSADGGSSAVDGGSAVAEFAAVGALLTLLFLLVLQVALVLHVRATAADCASEGARFGALVGSSPEAGAERARQLLRTSLSARYAGEVTAAVVEVEGAAVVQVRVRAPLPVVGLLGAGRGLDVRGHALLEEALLEEALVEGS
ncbi:TadE-like protein [Kineococcus xinjiangensis]|uniref:TadE-like protein n=1 Tax=Kineococcus xinjiangensis TaxID=512762 RepID=A0A2S6ICU3_9ACTN|nr:TadE/TadG family type IV pilus assembly protein [Kineococcus xinjiangensis]PPK92017.1 TadE-like protein [Kineococcus xinjiangensis]